MLVCIFTKELIQLTHLRDRLLLVKELLHESGSVFVQISDENVHHVREVLDEVFKPDNFVALISFRTKTGRLGAKFIDSNFDYLLWYGKDISQLKYRSIFQKQNIEGDNIWCWIELPSGERRRLKKEEINNHSLLPKGSKVFRLRSLAPVGFNANATFSVNFGGKKYGPPGPKGRKSWATNEEGVEKLISGKRVMPVSNHLEYIYYYYDFPFTAINNNWADTRGATNKIYVVQTDDEIIKRCMLMTTDPGDLVLDPTCGGGTTAYVAEQWGRRWITCDTSRVSITLAKQRMMTAKYDYFELAHKEEGIKSGFVYQTATHITLKTVANKEPFTKETLYDQPVAEKNKVRVTGPFTVEAVPSLRVKPFDGKEPRIEGSDRELSQTGETGNQTLYRDELKTTGIRTTGGEKIEFSMVEPMLATRFLHAKGEILEKGKTKKAYISFGPDFGPMEQRQAEEAIKEARELKERPDFVIFAAFHFDPEAAKDIDQMDWPQVQILKAQMSMDLLTADLRKKRSSNQSYWLIGQPDVEVVKEKGGKYKVRVNGFDYYNPISGEIESKSNTHIAMWFLDTDYDERSLLPNQVFFPMKDSKRDWTKLAKALNGEIDEELIEAFTGVESLPFEAGAEKKIAVKIIDNRGIESFVIKNLE